MKNLFRMMRWDMVLLYRQGLVWVSLFIATLYGISLYYFKEVMPVEVVVLLIFSDPVMVGFIFIGAVTLLEKEANTFQALIVNPLKQWQYLWSKALCLTIVAFPITIVMVWAVGFSLQNMVLLLPGVGLTSVFFVFLGFAGAARVHTFNQYIIVIPIFLLPLCVPLVQLLGVYPGDWIFIVPTQASIELIRGAFVYLSSPILLYSILYLLFSTGMAYLYARYSFEKYIIKR